MDLGRDESIYKTIASETISQILDLSCKRLLKSLSEIGYLDYLQEPYQESEYEKLLEA